MVDNWQFSKIAQSHFDEIMDTGEIVIDFNRTLRWMALTWGWVIETIHIDEEQTKTIETLVSYNGETATITHRRRCGPNFNEMKSYVRDSEFPVPCIVNLLPCSEQSSYHTRISEKA